MTIPGNNDKEQTAKLASTPGILVLLRQHFYEVLCLALFVVSIVFLCQSVAYLAKRDYAASLILTAVGVSVAHLAGKLARLALADRY